MCTELFCMRNICHIFFAFGSRRLIKVVHIFFFRVRFHLETVGTAGWMSSGCNELISTNLYRTYIEPISLTYLFTGVSQVLNNITQRFYDELDAIDEWKIKYFDYKLVQTLFFYERCWFKMIRSMAPTTKRELLCPSLRCYNQVAYLYDIYLTRSPK